MNNYFENMLEVGLYCAIRNMKYSYAQGQYAPIFQAEVFAILWKEQ